MFQKTIIVIPCYNESGRLKADFLDAFLARPDVALVLVDDGSSDGTGSWLRSWAQKVPGRAQVLALGSNAGKGEAVRRGMLLALEGNPDCVGYVDGDGATPALECLRLLERLEQFPPEVTAVLAARVKLLGFDIQRRLFRHYAGRVFATGASCLLSLPVYDTQCGAKFFRGVPAVARAFQTPFRSRWLFDVELIGRLSAVIRAAGGNPDGALSEIPLQAWHDIPGTKRGLSVYACALWDLIRMGLSLSRFKKTLTPHE